MPATTDIPRRSHTRRDARPLWRRKRYQWGTAALVVAAGAALLAMHFLVEFEWRDAWREFPVWLQQVNEPVALVLMATLPDRKSTRLNSSHSQNSYAVFCLK